MVISRAAREFCHVQQLAVEKLSVKLDALDPRRMLKNGYVFVSDAVTGEAVCTSRKAPGTRLDLTFADGVMSVKVEKKSSSNSVNSDLQGELFENE